MTLLRNADEAIEKQGIVTITTWADDENVHVRIEDTGRGIPEDQLATLFDLGFSVKGSRVGLRIGLHNAYGAVRKHGGQIDVRSELGKRTEFTIRLPIRSR